MSLSTDEFTAFKELKQAIKENPGLTEEEKISKLAKDLNVAIPGNIREKTEEEQREMNRRIYDCDMTDRELIKGNCPKLEQIIKRKKFIELTERIKSENRMPTKEELEELESLTS